MLAIIPSRGFPLTSLEASRLRVVLSRERERGQEEG
jgi:hypothetical protein